MYFPDGRLTNFTVDVNRWKERNDERKQCLYFNGTAQDLMNLTCTGSIWGRYVTISKTGRNLTLCEVEVYSDVDENRPVFSQGEFKGHIDHTTAMESYQRLQINPHGKLKCI